MNTITDDQIAEIEAAVSFQQTRSYTDVENGTVLALITRLREAERDAERWRWLIKNSTYGISCRQRPEITVPIFAPDHIDELDAAIDAAMQAAREAAE